MTATAARRPSRHDLHRGPTSAPPSALPMQDPVQLMLAEVDRERAALRRVLGATLATLVLALAALLIG